MAQRFLVSPVEPTAPLQRVAKEFPGVCLGVDPLCERPDFVDVPAEYTEGDIGRLGRRMKHYGYRLDLLEDLRKMDDSSYQEIQEALDDLLGHRVLPAQIVESLLLMEEAADTLASELESTLEKNGMPRGVGEAIEQVHDYLYSPQGMGLPNDASVVDISRALALMWKRFHEDSKRKLDEIDRKLRGQGASIAQLQPVVHKNWFSRLFSRIVNAFRMHPVWSTLAAWATGTFVFRTLPTWGSWLINSVGPFFTQFMPGLAVAGFASAGIALLLWKIAKWSGTPSQRELDDRAKLMQQYHFEKVK